ncbi:PKD domain-containing protein [Pedobacter frigoris]|uniref:PKD domain-containing protein n=1 Tax=Pedobacter frigoris TaxID=2571272 RepID=A0A4U1CGX1_9SPHI|nr:PKD domain-containing protein [Pedobacter frigoris]TKC05122.1 PKD domain-containing protein [Pedobacter frigoris]
MKKRYLLYFFSLFLSLAGCKDDEITRIEPTGDFNVHFDFPQGEITAPTKLILVNRSRFSEKFLWKFPNGKTLSKQGLSEGATSEKVVPDTLVYAIPGNYKVTLVAWQGGRVDSITREINVVKMKPRIVVPENILVLGEFEFKGLAFKFPDKNLTFSWDFGEPGLTSTLQNPKVIFKTEGIHTVKLTINDGEETLVTTVQVNVKGELAKILYFTDVVTNKIYKYALTTNEATRKVEPLSITTGVNPFGLSVYNGRLYVNEPGNIIKFPSGALPETVAWQNGDGQIYSVDLEGKDKVVLTQNTGLFTGAGTGYQIDPFNHAIDQAGMMYFVIRNNGIRTVSTTAKQVQYPGAFITPAPADNGGTSVSTWVDGAIRIVKNEIWMSKASSAGKAIFVYRKDKTFSKKIDINSAVKSFVVDTVGNKIYFTSNFGTKGLFKCNLDGTNVQLIDDLANFSNQGGANEQTFVTGMALDIRPGDANGGYLYIGFRHNDTIKENVAPANPNASTVNAAEKDKSGIYRYELNGSNAKTFLIKGYAPYGLAIDNTLR